VQHMQAARELREASAAQRACLIVDNLKDACMLHAVCLDDVGLHTSGKTCMQCGVCKHRHANVHRGLFP